MSLTSLFLWLGRKTAIQIRGKNFKLCHSPKNFKRNLLISSTVVQFYVNID